MDPDGDLITEADEPSPETFDNPALDASDEPIPETFDIPAPDASDEPIPETFDYPAPDACDEPTPHTSDEPTPETSGIGSLNGAELRPSRKSSVSSASSNSSASSISTVGVTEKDLKKGCLVNVVWSILPAFLITVTGFGIILCWAFEVLSYSVMEMFFFCLYVVAILGMLQLLMLHACDKLTAGSHKGRPDKKRGFMLGGIFILGSGGMIYESLTLYSVSIVFDRCPAYRSLVLSSADLFVSGLQVLFLVKFLSVRINRSVSAVCFSRFVLMIMVAANLCLWFLTIIKESLHEIHDLHEIKDTNTTPNSSPYPSDPVHEDPVTDNGSSTGNDTQGPVFMAASSSQSDPYDPCGEVSAVADIVSPYCYPLLIEFSVLAAGLFLAIWEQTGTKQPDHHHTHESNGGGKKNDLEDRKSIETDLTSLNESPIATAVEDVHYHNPGEGMFLGWIVNLGTVVFVILFIYVSYDRTAITISFGTAVYGFHAALSGLQLITVLFTAVSMAKMKTHHEEKAGAEKRDESLLTVCFLSLALYKVFCTVAGFADDKLSVIVDGLVAIAATIAQTTFLNWFASHKRLANAEQRRHKPGRQGLELLRWTNVALWLVNTFLMKTTVAKSPLEHTIGAMTWTIVSNVVQPLTILYYFHSVMCIAGIISDVHSR